MLWNYVLFERCLSNRELAPWALRNGASGWHPHKQFQCPFRGRILWKCSLISKLNVNKLTSVSASERTQMQAARRRKPSSSYIRMEFGFSFTMMVSNGQIKVNIKLTRILMKTNQNVNTLLNSHCRRKWNYHTFFLHHIIGSIGIVNLSRTCTHAIFYKTNTL